MGDRKRPHEDEEGQRYPKRDRRNDKVIKVLCPFYSAGAVIGQGGEAIKEIKNDTGANIQVSKVRFPHTDERVITISGQLEPMQKVVAFVQDKIRTDKIPPHVKNINVHENDARKATCKLLVPDTSIGRIIGKAGANIKRLQEEFNVKIGTMKKEDAIDGLRERIITVESDNQGNVDGCIADMVKEVYEDERAHMDFHVDYDSFASSRGPSKAGYDAERSSRGGYGGRDAGYGGRDAGYGSRDSGYGARDAGYGPRDSGYGPRDSGYGPRDSGYGARDSGYGPRDPGYGPRDSGYGPRDAGYGATDSGYGSRDAGYGGRDGSSGYGYNSRDSYGGYESEKRYGGESSYGGGRQGYGNDRGSSYNSAGGYSRPAPVRGGRGGGYGPPDSRPRNY